MKPRILITGAAGFLGYHLTSLLNENFVIGGTYHNNFSSAKPISLFKADITNPQSIDEAIESFKPDYVVHTAAAADVDWCHKNPDAAFKINCDGSSNAAIACKNSGAKMIHISTDIVFDGEKGDYTEDDEAIPNTIYGESKLAAEKAVIDASADNLIFRVALLYGPESPFKKGYVRSVLDRVSKGDKVPFFSDQIRTPLYTGDVASAIEKAIEKDAPGGIYHICGNEKLSRLEFGMKMQEVYGFDKDLIKPSTMEDVPEMSLRPRDVSMLYRKANSVFGFEPTPLKDALLKI